MKKCITIIGFLLFFALVTPLFAGNNTCNGTNQHPCIVQDTQKNQVKLKSFRTAKMLADAYKGNTQGLSELWLSGASALSQKDWEAMHDLILKATGYQVKNIIDVDLRQESHGYLNNDAINLTGTSNWINLNKNHETILRDEAHWLHSLKSLKEIPNVLLPDQFKSKQFAAGNNIPVHVIADEKTIVEKVGFHYFRLTVLDHRVPSDSEVDRFMELMQKLSPHTWLHVHCRGGKGRTTTFMAMVDMLKNANKVSFEEIINRQAAVSPFYNLFEFEEKNPEFYVDYQERLNFLREFYRYAVDRLHGYSGNWTSWKHARSI